MSGRFAVLAVSLCLVAPSTFAAFTKAQNFRPATTEELAMKEVASAPGVPAAILDWVRVDDDTSSSSSEYVRMKIFTDEGKKYGDIEISYSTGYPYYSHIEGISARTIRPDGTIVPFDGKVYDKVVVKVGGNSVRAKTFSLADVQPGSILEYRYDRRWSENLLINTFWPVQQDLPVAHAKFTLKPYLTNEFSSYFTYVGLPEGKVPVKVPQVGYELELTDIPAFVKEEYAPPVDSLKPHVNFYYTTSRTNPEQFWDTEAKVWSKKVESFIGKSEKARTFGTPLRAGSPAEAAAKIYAHVQGLRNYSFEDDKSDQEVRREKINEAKNVEDVLRKGSGFRDELNRVFVAIAREAGLKSDVVRVAPRDRNFFSAKLADADQINTEVAVVEIDGKEVYLDPGTPRAPFGIVSWEKSNVPGFRISKNEAPKFLSLPPVLPNDAVTKRSADLKMNGDTLEGTVTVTFTGQEALIHRLRLLNEDEAARKKSLEDEAKGWFPDGAVVKSTTIAGLDTHDGPMTATFEVSVPNLVSRAGSRIVVPVSIFESTSRNPFAPEKRKHSIYFPYTYTEEDEIKLSLPEGLAITAMPPVSELKGGALNYRSEAKSAGREVTFHRSLLVDTMMVEAKFYPALRNFFSQVLNADQKPLVLVEKN